VVKHFDVFPVLLEALAPFVPGVTEPYEPQSEIQPPQQLLHRVPIDVVRPAARVMTNGMKRDQWTLNVLPMFFGPHDLARKNTADVHPAHFFAHLQIVFDFLPLCVVSVHRNDVF